MGGVGRPISKGEPRNFIQKALNFPAQPRNFIQTTSYAKRWQPRSCDSQYHFIIDNRFLLNFTKCSLFWLQHNSHFPHFGETGCPFPLDGAALCFLPSLWPHEAILPAPDFLLQVPLPIHPIALSPSQPLILQPFLSRLKRWSICHGFQPSFSNWNCMPTNGCVFACQNYNFRLTLSIVENFCGWFGKGYFYGRVFEVFFFDFFHPLGVLQFMHSEDSSPHGKVGHNSENCLERKIGKVST